MQPPLQEQLTRWRRLFQCAPIGIAVVSVSGATQGQIVDANHRLASLLGYEPNVLEGARAVELLHADERIRGSEELARLVAGAADVVDANARLSCADGTLRGVRLSARALTDSDGAAEAVVVHVLDLGSSSVAEREEVGRRLARAQDLARLGSFEWAPQTDSFVISDELFRLFGLRPGSLPGTLQAFEPLLHPDDASPVMDGITATLADGRPRTFEFRFRGPEGTFRWAETRVAADRNRDGVVARLWGTMQDIHERRLGEDMLRCEVAELEQVAAIRAAVVERRLRIDAQEIVDLASGAPVGSELLVRIVDTDGTLLTPDRFLPLAERHGVIQDIDAWVLEQAVELAAGGQRVAVNVSARTMSDPEYAQTATRLLQGRRGQAGLLTFEITETALVEDYEHARQFALQIESLGCTLALDDFGTGFGALTYIKKLPAHFLKIDREFVSDVADDPRSRAVVRGVVNLAKSFGQKTIAEGVEDSRTLETLRGLGVDLAQGYYLSRPCWIAGAGREL